MGGKDGSPGATITWPQILVGNAILFAMIALWFAGLVWLDTYRDAVAWYVAIPLGLLGLHASALVVLAVVEAVRASWRVLVGLAAALALSGCAMFGSAPVYGEIPECEKLIPPSLTGPVEGVPLPDVELYDDGHEKAEPWQQAFLGQTGQLDKANDRPAAVDYIYRNCLQLHRDALKRSKRGPLGRLFH